MEINHEQFMKKAIQIAINNLERNGGGPFGAVVVKDGEIIGEGHNEVIQTNDPTSHAEIVAIRKACDKLGTYHLHGCTIYSSCEPCPMCLGAIYWARLDGLYFAANRENAAHAGFADKHIYDELTKDLKIRSIPTYQILDLEGKSVFERWAKMGLKIIY
jgi:tRNA(Arg) A34 adenosine deaminase TadA